jgi:hypothetical protein
MIASRQHAFAVAVAMVAAVTLAACDRLGLGPNQFIIKVDSISAPDTLRTTDTLRVRSWGFIGPSGCYRLDNVYKERRSNEILIQFNGLHVEETCTQALVFLDYTDKTAPPLANPFTIKVKQPDGSIMSRSVNVR